MTRERQVGCDCEPSAAACLFRARDYISGDEFEIFQCTACGLAFTYPMPEGWTRYYPPAYFGDIESGRFPRLVEWLQNQLYARRARRVQKLAGGKPGNVLDIGCGRGYLLRAFHRCRWNVLGTEMSDGAAAYARQKLNLPVQVGELENLRLPENSFDAVVMWHVLEHFPRPHEVLREAHRVLRPGGILLVAVPNFGSLEARLTRDKWFHLDVPRHLTHFTRPALLKCLTENRLVYEAITSRSLEYDWFSATQSSFNRLGLRHNFLYNLLRRRGARMAGGASWWQIIAHALLLPVANVAGFMALVAGGSTQTIYARKLK